MTGELDQISNRNESEEANSNMEAHTVHNLRDPARLRQLQRDVRQAITVGVINEFECTFRPLGYIESEQKFYLTLHRDSIPQLLLPDFKHDLNTDE